MPTSGLSDALDDQVREWGGPELFTTPEPVEIPADILPGYLGEFAAALSKNAQTPEGLAVSVILGVLATAVQKKFEIAPRNGKYKETLSLWTVCVLPSGGGKSGILSQAKDPLRAWEKAEAKLKHFEIIENTHARDIAHRRIETIKAKAAKSGDGETALQEIRDIERNTPREIVAPHVYCDDVTPETLQMLLATHDERMGLISDEGGIFSVMAGLYSNGAFNNNVFLQAHAGSDTRTDRLTRNVALEHPALSFALGVQPDTFEGMAPSTKKRFRGNGTFARFLFFVPESTVGHRDLFNEFEVPDNIAMEYNFQINRILNIPDKRDEEGRIVPTVLTLAPEAKAVWVKFAAYIDKRCGDNGDLADMKDWGGKIAGAAARIAGILHIAMTGGMSTVVDLPIMERSLDLAEVLISHAKAIFGLIGEGQEDNDAKIILKWILSMKLKEFTQREAWQRFKSRFSTTERVTEALKELTGRHFISEPVAVTTGGRRPTLFKVNPVLFEGRA
jgi:putative DNA primase/helicase